MPEDEFRCGYCMLDKESYMKSQRTAGMVNEMLVSVPKDDNAAIRKSGVDFAPLLEGCI